MIIAAKVNVINVMYTLNSRPGFANALKEKERSDRGQNSDMYLEEGESGPSTPFPSTTTVCMPISEFRVRESLPLKKLLMLICLRVFLSLKNWKSPSEVEGWPETEMRGCTLLVRKGRVEELSIHLKPLFSSLQSRKVSTLAKCRRRRGEASIGCALSIELSMTTLALFKLSIPFNLGLY